MKSASVSKRPGDNKPSKKLEKSFIPQIGFIWYILGVIVRIVWTVVYPQQGYIHPVSEE